MAGDKSVVGDLINFRGLLRSCNEDGVVFLFGRVVDDLHMYVEEVKPGFPDCIAGAIPAKDGRGYRLSSSMSNQFPVTIGTIRGCDIVVCWEHDWKNCP
jgi:hypothetical protein